MKVSLASLLMCILLLSGCSDETDLFTGLSESESNDVIAELADHHIDARKRLEKTGVVVAVAADEIHRAVRVLEVAGLPRRAKTSLGEIFKKEGVISTPLEERARYIYALSQELETTLSQIDGVVAARVHVVLPERVAPGEPVQPASAAVFIKHTAALDPDSVRGRIQQMVASSIPGMSAAGSDPKKFAIVFVPAAVFHDTEQLVSLGPFLIDQERREFWITLIWFSFVGIVLLMAGLVLLLRSDWRQALFQRLKLTRSRSVTLVPRS